MALSAEPETRLRVSVKRPSWRVLDHLKRDDLEDELRKRDEYDIAGVTQWGDEYTLILRHKRLRIRDQESL